MTDVLQAVATQKDKPCELLRVDYERHSGGSNYNFLDGHAKWLRMEQTLAPNFLWGEYEYPHGN